MSKHKRIPIKLPPAKYLRECFTYNPKTGVIRWRERPRRHFDKLRIWKMWNVKFAGTVAGVISKHGKQKYQLNALGGKLYRAHRVIWKMMTGKEPPVSIDHKDGNGTNNRWGNLREATPSQQLCNVGLIETNTSGYRGVSRKRLKWRVRICVGGVHYNCGAFDTPQQAAAVYKIAMRELHGEFYRKGGRA